MIHSGVAIKQTNWSYYFVRYRCIIRLREGGGGGGDKTISIRSSPLCIWKPEEKTIVALVYCRFSQCVNGIIEDTCIKVNFSSGLNLCILKLSGRT